MTPESRVKREHAIEAAAYALLAERGYGGMSMLAVAKGAKASNETLYKWYGDKLGLVTAMIERNASEARSILEEALTGSEPPEVVLNRLAPALLRLLTGTPAVALNRAAAADPSGELGRALARSGRGALAPMICDVIERLQPARGTEPAFGLFMSLLVGDLQIRRAIGALKPLSEAEISERARIAVADYLKLTEGSVDG